MIKKYTILTEFAKDVSCETPDVETYLQTKENISKYNLKLDINSKPLKNQIIEVNLISTFQETSLVRKKSNFEITYAAIVRVDENVTDKKEIKKIILIDIPSEIYPRLEDLFVSLVNKAGFPDVKIERRIDFEKLYNEKFN